jgi:hypothetical protein
MITCEVVFGRLGPDEIATVNVCAGCGGTGQRGGGDAADTPVACAPCNQSGRVQQAGYAYASADEVQVGDVVGTPASEWRGAGEGTVVRVGSTYTGQMKYLTGVVLPAAQRPEMSGEVPS